MTPRGARASMIAAAPMGLVWVLALASTHDAASAPSADASLDRPPPADARPESSPRETSPLPPLDARVEVFLSDVSPDLGPDVGARLDAIRPIPPDPTPLATDAVFVLTVRFNRGDVMVEKVKCAPFGRGRKEALPRHFGRFAAELYVGPTLLERLRFDFPLLADDDAAGESYAKGLDVSIDVKIPDSDRPTRLEIWDRARDRRWIFPYPPKLTP